MKCRRAQSDIALWAGGDLDEAGQAGLRRHLDCCPQCQGYMREMQLLMRLVDECPLRDQGDETSQRAVEEESLWPSLSTRLVTLSTPRHDHFNGWIPAVTVAAVCLAMVLIASPPQMPSPQETPVTSKSREDSWPMSPSASNQSLSRVLPQWDRPPILQSVDAAPPKTSVTVKPPQSFTPHPIERMHQDIERMRNRFEKMLNSKHERPRLREADPSVKIYIDQSDPWNTTYYIYQD